MTTYSKSITDIMHGWVKVNTSDFTAAPTASNAFATTRDLTNELKVGDALRITNSSPATTYAVISAITASSVTIYGSALPYGSGTITKLEHADSNRVKQLTFNFIGPYSAVASTTLMASFNQSRWFWKNAPARIVHAFTISNVVGATAHTITVYNDTYDILSAYSLSASASGSSTTYNLSPTYNRLVFGSEIEVGTTLGSTTGTLANNLSVQLVIVME